MPPAKMINRDDKQMREAADDELKTRRDFIEKRENYYRGIQRKHLKLDNGIDRNIVDNLCEVVIDSTADFIAHDFPELSVGGQEDLSDTLREAWEGNEGVDWLLEAVTQGGLAGHCFAKVTQEGDILNLDAKHVILWWNPDNRREILWYELQWGKNASGMTTMRQDIVPAMTEDGLILVGEDGYPVRWEIYDYVRKGGKWDLVDEPAVWDYPLPPIVHWQHLPGKIYGMTELPDHAITLQDAVNKETSDIQAIFNYFSGPTTVITGAPFDSDGDVEAVTIGGLLALENDAAKVYNVEMQSDLVAMREERDSLKAAFFRRARVTQSPSSLDQVRNITNMAVRTVYMPMTNKANTIRRKYGEGIKQISQRLMMLAGRTDWRDVMIDIEWGSNLPVDQRETLQLLMLEYQLGVISKRMIADKLGRNYDEVREDLLLEASDSAMLLDGAMMGSMDTQGVNGA